MEGSPGGSVARGLRVFVLAWCALWAVIWLALALVRLRYPYELEWIGGAMRDHCERVLAGRPLYVPPGPRWFPYEYPPLYFWLSAELIRLFHVSAFFSMRLISILCTIGCCTMLALWVYRISPGRSGRVWSAIAAGIFLATYRFTGAWYDVERLDMLFLFLSLLGGYWLAAAFPGGGNAGFGSDHADRTYKTDRSYRFGGLDNAISLLLSAAAFWLAFLAKQQAVLFIVGGAAALAWRRDWRGLALFGGIAGAACLCSVYLLNRGTGGWFGYYCFHVPLANGARLHLAVQYLLQDLPLYAPAIALAIGALLALRRANGSSSTADCRLPIAAPLHPTPYTLIPTLSWCAMGLAGSLLSRAHWGGDQNVLMAGYIGLTLLACGAAARLERALHVLAAPLYALALAQLLPLVYRPDAQLPGAAQRAAAARYAAEVRTLEREGEVLCLDHGGLTTPSHFQIMALLDVIGSEKRMPPALLVALQRHRYAAILVDAVPDANGALGPILTYYRPAERLHLETTWTVTGFPTPATGRDVWVLRPRR